MSCTDDARMCGTPQPSRSTVTCFCNPATLTVPSICGSGRYTTHHTTPQAISTTMDTSHINQRNIVRKVSPVLYCELPQAQISSLEYDPGGRNWRKFQDAQLYRCNPTVGVQLQPIGALNSRGGQIGFAVCADRHPMLPAHTVIPQQ